MKKKEQKPRDEAQFKKETKMGAVFVVVAVIIIVIQLVINVFFTKEEKKPTAAAEPTQNVRVVNQEAVTSAALSAAGETVPDEHGEQKQEIQLKELNKEVLTLLNAKKTKLKEIITDFAEEYGYGYADSAVYYGQTVINHGDNTVTCSFAFDNGEEDMKDSIKFDIKYFRETKTYQCVMW